MLGAGLALAAPLSLASASHEKDPKSPGFLSHWEILHGAHASHLYLLTSMWLSLEQYMATLLNVSY